LSFLIRAQAKITFLPSTVVCRTVGKLKINQQIKDSPDRFALTVNEVKRLLLKIAIPCGFK